MGGINIQKSQGPMPARFKKTNFVNRKWIHHHEVLSELGKQPFWSRLDDDIRNALVRLLLGVDQRSIHSRRKLWFFLMKDPNFKILSLAEQKKVIVELLNAEDTTPRFVKVDFPVYSKIDKIEGPVAHRQHIFKAGGLRLFGVPLYNEHQSSCDAFEYHINIDGKMLPVFIPLDEGGKPVYPIGKIADVLVRVPPILLQSVMGISLYPPVRDQPQNVAAIANLDRTVTIFPSYDDHIRPDTFVHETAHTWSMQRWGTTRLGNNAPHWKEWGAAVRRDALHVSMYSRLSFYYYEGFAEALTLFFSVRKNTTDYANARQRYNEQFLILEQLFPGCKSR